MSGERWFAAGVLAAIVLAGLSLLRRRSPFHLPVLALVATGLVGAFFPLATTWIEPSSWRNLDRLSDEIVLAVQVEYAAFAAGLLLSVLAAAQLGWLASREGAPLARSSASTSAGRDLAMSLGLVGGGLAIYALYVQRVGPSALLDRHDYAQKYLLGQGLGPLQFGLPLAILGCLWAEASPLERAIRHAFRAVAAAIAIASIALISVRTHFVVLAFGYGTILAARRGWELRRIRPALVVALLGLYVLLEAFALFRGLHTTDVGEAVAALRARGEQAIASAVGGSELSHPFVTAGEVLRDREPGELAGRSLVDGLSACLPRGIHPDRPPMLSEQFVRSHYADLAARGGGTAFSLVAEAWLDFGSIVGPLVFGLALGLVLAWAERVRARVPAGIVARVVPYFAFYVAMEHRNEFGTLFKQVFMVSCAVVPLWLAAGVVARATPRRIAPARAAGSEA